MLPRCITLILICSTLPLAAQAPSPASRQRIIEEFNERRARASGAPKTPVATLGERIFQDTRFAQFFAANYDGNVNHRLKEGDPIMANIKTPSGDAPGPFWNDSMNCRQCHLVDELEGPPIFPRVYADYIPKSPVPDRGDGQTTTARNSRGMVDAFVRSKFGLLLHADGEFSSTAALVESTLTGRNMGWLPSEHDQAIAHIARVIREDDGNGLLARLSGGSYRRLFLGTHPGIPAEFRIPAQYRIDVLKASDREVVRAVADVIAAYMESLVFLRDSKGDYSGSPYDLFLKLNGLPAAPNPGESDDEYATRLASAIDALKNPVFVTPEMATFLYHSQLFVFGELELQGMRVFLRRSPKQPSTTAGEKSTPRLPLLIGLSCIAIVALVCGGAGARRITLTLMLPAAVLVAIVQVREVRGAPTSTGEGGSAHAGNCVSCHMPPHFTDFKFHNTGATQEEYDSVHGAGAFTTLPIPGFVEREQNRDKYLPATPRHPKSAEVFRSTAIASDAKRADLGLWNVYANIDFPEPQQQISEMMCGKAAPCEPASTLPRTIALFRTPSIRDLGQSEPYLHTGRMQTIEDVLTFYQQMSALQNAGKLRNGDPDIGAIDIDADDTKALAAFLRSLNEDYD